METDFLFFFAGNRAPVFRYTKTFFTVKKGADLRILLDVTGAPFPGISCYYGDRLIISCSGETIQNTDISIHSSAFEPACRMGKYVITGLHELIITFASFAENDGMYKCEANNSVATVGVSFRVNVTGKIFYYKRFLYFIVVYTIPWVNFCDCMAFDRIVNIKKVKSERVNLTTCQEYTVFRRLDSAIHRIFIFSSAVKMLKKL